MKAGELHQAVGGYPGPDARMPNCCSVMRSVLREKGGVIVYQPPKGNGASLTIRYQLAPQKKTTDNSDPARKEQMAQTRIDEAIYQKIISTAETKATVTYQELASVKGLTMNNPADRARLANLLGEISRFEHAGGRPMLSVVVVSKTSGMPGQGFFQLARELRVHDAKDDLAFFVSELNKVYEYWAPCSNEPEDEGQDELSGETAEVDLKPPVVVEPEERKQKSHSDRLTAGGHVGSDDSSSETPEISEESESTPGFLRRMLNMITSIFHGK